MNIRRRSPEEEYDPDETIASSQFHSLNSTMNDISPDGSRGTSQEFDSAEEDSEVESLTRSSRYHSLSSRLPESQSYGSNSTLNSENFHSLRSDGSAQFRRELEAKLQAGNLARQSSTLGSRSSLGTVTPATSATQLADAQNFGSISSLGSSRFHSLDSRTSNMSATERQGVEKGGAKATSSIAFAASHAYEAYSDDEYNYDTDSTVGSSELNKIPLKPKSK